MGAAAAADLAVRPGVVGVTIADADLARAEKVAASVKNGRAVRLDAKKETETAKILEGHAAAVSAVPYAMAPAVARAAVGAKCSLVDLGGNSDATRVLLGLHAEAKREGIGIVPDMGLAPGLSNVLVGAAVAALGGRAAAARIRVGGLPQDPPPPLGYRLVFSARGLLNEYLGKSRVLRAGQPAEADALSEVEHDDFPPLGILEAFHTVGGTSTLPETFQGAVANLDEKTLRYPGHRDSIALLLALGLGSEQPVKLADGSEAAPRDVLEAVLERALPSDGRDLVVMRVEAEGGADGRPGWVRYDLLDRADPATGFTAMQRTTAFPAAAVAFGLAKGAVELRGAAPPEKAVPAEWLLRELEPRGIRIARTEGSARKR